MPIKNRLRRIRLDMDITQDEFAKILGISQQQVSKFENQKITNPEAETILRISKKLKMQVEKIFYLED